MKLELIQAYVVAQISANTTLAAMGTPIAFSYFTDDETAATTITAAIRSRGVCFEVGVVEATGDSTKPQFRASPMDAKFDVLIAESPLVAHTPQEMQLVSLVANAVQARATPTSPAIRCIGYGSAKSEHGYVLHALSFTMAALL